MYVNLSVDVNVKPIVNSYSKYQRVERGKIVPRGSCGTLDEEKEEKVDNFQGKRMCFSPSGEKRRD